MRGQGLLGSDSADAEHLGITIHTQHLPCSTPPITTIPGYWIALFIHLRNSASHQKYSPTQVQWSSLGTGMQFPAFSFNWKASRALGLLGSASLSSYYSRVLNLIWEGTVWKMISITPEQVAGQIALPCVNSLCLKNPHLVVKGLNSGKFFPKSSGGRGWEGFSYRFQTPWKLSLMGHSFWWWQLGEEYLSFCL